MPKGASRGVAASKVFLKSIATLQEVLMTTQIVMEKLLISKSYSLIHQLKLDFYHIPLPLKGKQNIDYSYNFILFYWKIQYGLKQVFIQQK